MSVPITSSPSVHNNKFAHPVLYGVLYLRDRLLCNAVANQPPLSLSNTGLWASPWPPSQHGHKSLCDRRPRPIATPSYCAGRRPRPRFFARRSRISDMIRYGWLEVIFQRHLTLLEAWKEATEPEDTHGDG